MRSTANLLLVEGKDDEHVFNHLLMHHDIPEIFQIKNKGGIANLLGTLDVELAASELERLGIVVDANLDIEGRWIGPGSPGKMSREPRWVLRLPSATWMLMPLRYTG